jgi:hypothetical protein
MESELRVEIHAGGDLPAALEISELLAKGKFTAQHIRNGEVIGEYEFPNGIVDAGLNSILGIMFHSDTQITAWYLGLIDNSGFSALANADVMSSHSGWNEFTTYSQSTRPQWSPGASSSRSITNGTTVDFSITGSGTMKGIFVVNNSTKSGTTGTLWSTAAFGSTVAVQNGDTLKVTYTVSG